jgi:hypothetical protein
LCQHQVATIVQCLRRLVDELTPRLKDEMESLPPRQRKIVHTLVWVLDDPRRAVADFSSAIELGESAPGITLAAFANRFRVEWLEERTDDANRTLGRFSRHLATQSADQRPVRLMAFLAQIAAPELRLGWAHAARRLFESQPPEAQQPLAFLEPVSAILEGGARALLDPLPPEQREFTLHVLGRLQPQ